MPFVLAVPLLLLVIIWLIYTYNQFIRLLRQTDEAWANIDAMLKRRYDLIPNLVEVVQGYAKHEKQLFEHIAKTRSEALESPSLSGKAKKDAEITTSVRTLFAIAENYPKLRASDNFLNLQKQLVQTEDLLEKARRYYNGSVRDLNTAREMFPNNLFVSAFGIKPREFFGAETTEREVVKV